MEEWGGITEVLTRLLLVFSLTERDHQPHKDHQDHTYCLPTLINAAFIPLLHSATLTFGPSSFGPDVLLWARQHDVSLRVVIAPKLLFCGPSNIFGAICELG